MTTPAVIEKGGMALLVELETNGALSATGLSLTDPNLPYEEFETICFVLGKMHEAVRFAIGDAIIFGEMTYAEEAYQALESLNISEEGKREYVRVAERVPRSRRRGTLSWSHHRAVAALEPVQQKEWLKKAADEGLSHHALRDALRAGGVTQLPVADSPARCECCKRLL